MAKIKLKQVEKDLTYTPDFQFENDQGEIVSNRELPESEQVKVEITLAGRAEKSKYVSLNTNLEDKVNFSDFKYNECIRNHVKKVIGLESVGIKTAEDMIKYSFSPEIDLMVQDVFLKVCGVKEEDTLSPKK